MTPPIDVLVVGGGPGGATLAALTAAAGLRTALVERARFPRDKVCGEFVSADGCGVLERLGVLDRLLDRGATWMDSCRITDRHGIGLDTSLPELQDGSRRALGISRATMDATLLAHAADRGVDVLERTEVLAPILASDRAVGVVVREVGRTDKHELHAAVVVAADGRRSALGRALQPGLGDPGRSRAGSWFGLKLHVRGRAERLGRRVELHLFDGGYAGIGAVEDDRLNVCMMTSVGALRACGGQPDRLLRERVMANPAARASLGEAVSAGEWQTIGPLRFAARRPSAAGVLFVGDAAGTIDPYSGEGMSHALRAAEMALPFVVGASARGRVGPETERGYARAWNAAFRPATRRVRRLGWLLERPRIAGPLLRVLARRGTGVFRRLVAATRSQPSGGSS